MVLAKWYMAGNCRSYGVSGNAVVKIALIVRKRENTTTLYRNMTIKIGGIYSGHWRGIRYPRLLRCLPYARQGLYLCFVSKRDVAEIKSAQRRSGIKNVSV